MNFHKLNWKTSTKLNAHLPSLKKGIEIPTLYFKFLQNLYPTKRKTKSQQFFFGYYRTINKEKLHYINALWGRSLSSEWFTRKTFKWIRLQEFFEILQIFKISATVKWIPPWINISSKISTFKKVISALTWKYVIDFYINSLW